MMLTAQSDEPLRERALAAGANVFLSKPFATVEFIRHVRHLASWAEKHTHGVVESSGERERDAILRLHRAMDTRDPRTARHMRIARDVAVEIATEMRLSRRDLDTLRWAALVYDIGKLAIPENVLGMPAQLSPASRALIHAHAEAGAGILAGSEATLLQAAESIARHHHERYDGEGYPDGLRGEEIPLLARIVAVADSLVALTSQRPHRGELPVLRCRRTDRCGVWNPLRSDGGQGVSTQCSASRRDSAKRINAKRAPLRSSKTRSAPERTTLRGRRRRRKRRVRRALVHVRRSGLSSCRQPRRP